jgi:hypothetical protein
MEKAKNPVILKLFMSKVTNIGTGKFFIFYLVSFGCEAEISPPSDAEKHGISTPSPCLRVMVLD